MLQGRHKRTGQLTAVKVVELIPDEAEDIKVEIDAEYSGHPNIPKFYGVCSVKVCACACVDARVAPR